MKPLAINTNLLRTVPGESKDCTVRAFCAASGLSYHEAHEIANAAGRVNRKPFWTDRILTKAWHLGLLTFDRIPMYDKDRGSKSGTTWRRWSLHYPTLAQVLPLLQKGRFIIETHNHALAVVNGIVYDGAYLRLRFRVHDIYEIRMKP